MSLSAFASLAGMVIDGLMRLRQNELEWNKLEQLRIADVVGDVKALRDLAAEAQREALREAERLFGPRPIG